MNAAALFDAEPMLHPKVLDAYQQAVRLLKRRRIRFRETGGIVLNLHGAGRPTKDVDLVVRRSDWQQAIRLLGKIASGRQGIRFGLADEPESRLAIIGPHGVPIELSPEGTTRRNRTRSRRAEKTLKGIDPVAFINDKLASYLSAGSIAGRCRRTKPNQTQKLPCELRRSPASCCARRLLPTLENVESLSAISL